VEIIETPIFTEKIIATLCDGEYRLLQGELVGNPEAGKLIPGCHGLRKLRWSIPGKGKRGGIRVIYYWHLAGESIYRLYVFKKNEQEDLTKKQQAALSAYVRRGVL